MPAEARTPFELAWVRSMIDRVDDAFLVLLAGRRQLVRRAQQAKCTTGLPGRDPQREQQVHVRAQYFAQRLGLPSSMTQKLTELLIEDACGLQGLPASSDTQHTEGPTNKLSSTLSRSTSMQTLPVPVERLLGHLPPPGRVFQPLRRLLPSPLLQAVIRKATLRVLAEPLASGALDDLQGRKLGIEVTDLQLQWVVEIGERDILIQVPGTAAESCVRGSATDLLLASRLEDADTLFFQRRLQLVGDTELGLMVRNLLDQLPWETIPLALRVFLNRGARLARLARSAHRGESVS